MSDLDDAELWERFHASTLPHALWTHRAHLRVAWLFLARHPLDEAHLLMRVGIIRLNAFHGLVETPQRGYHETLTRVWLTLVADAAARSLASSSTAFLDQHGDGLGVSAVQRHYSREHLLSPRARAVFVEPDLAPLPMQSARRPPS